MSQKTLAGPVGNFIKAPLVVDEGALYLLCAKRGQAAVGCGRGFR